MAKLSTKQAIRLATKKKKGKKPSKSNGIDGIKPGKSNNSKQLTTITPPPLPNPDTIDDITVCNNSDSQAVVPISPEILDTKTKMSDKELRFLYFYMAGGITVEQAMIFAGYKGYSETYLNKLGTQVIAKHECQVGDHRKIFRMVGAGETAIAMGLLTLAREANSEMVRHNAWNSLAKCLGLSKEVLEGVEGISIIINQGCAPAGEDQPAALTLDLPKAPPISSGLITITK